MTDVDNRPNVPISDYWIVGPILLLAFLCPIVAYFVWGTGIAVSRSGSLMVGLTIAAEFGLRIRSDIKHIRNAERAFHATKKPLDFSTSHQILSLISIVLVLSGTVIWGFAESWFAIS